MGLVQLVMQSYGHLSYPIILTINGLLERTVGMGGTGTQLWALPGSADSGARGSGWKRSSVGEITAPNQYPHCTLWMTASQETKADIVS